MTDTSRFADGSISQLAAIGAGVVATCVVGSVLVAIGISGALLAALFVLAGLIAAGFMAGKTVRVLPSTGGITLSIEALSAFGLFGIVGAVFAFGHDGFAVGIGLAAGIILNLMFVGPRFSAIAARSLPEFLSLRYGGDAIRYLALGVMTIFTVMFIAAQFVAAGLIAVQGLGIVPLGGVLIGAIAVLILAVPLKRDGLGRAQVVLATVAIAGILISAVWLLSAKTGILIPHFSYGGLFTDISAAENRLGLETHFGQPGEGLGFYVAMSLVVCLAVGSAVMPHLLARAAVEGSRSRSQKVLRNGAILIVVLATALPALGVLARTDLLALFTAEQNAVPFMNGLPDVLLHGAQICQTTVDAMPEVCAAQGYADGLPVEEMRIDPQSVLLALPALTGGAKWLTALLSLVALAVVGVAGAGALHTLASAFSSRSNEYDGPRTVSVVSFGITAVAAIIAAASGLSLINLAAWAYSLIGAAFVGPLIIGLSWPKTNAAGALAGMIGGFFVTALYIVGAQWGFDFTAETGDEWSWLGVPSIMAGIFGIGFSIFLTVVGSLAGPKPKPSQIAFLGARDATPKADLESLE